MGPVVALALEEGHGFASSGRDSSVTMFDLKTYQVLKKPRPPTVPTPFSTTLRGAGFFLQSFRQFLHRDRCRLGCGDRHG